jgi:hypothetical protein
MFRRLTQHDYLSLASVMLFAAYLVAVLLF